MSFKTHTIRSHTADVEDNELELPYGNAVDYADYHFEVVGDKAVFAYLIHDDDGSGCNPLKDYDCQGDLYTSRSNSITDDEGSALSALGLESFGGRFYDIERNLDHCGVEEKALELLRPMCVLPGGEHFDDFVAFCREEYEAVEDVSDSTLAVRMFDNDTDFSRYGTVIPSWLETAYENMREEAWDILQENGMIGDFLAVPVDYCSSNHGPGTASAGTTSIDSCNAAWVPDVGALDNILHDVPGYKVEFNGTETVRTLEMDGKVVTWKKHFPDAAREMLMPLYTKLYKKAEEYCESILDEYIMWCNGEVYGICVCTYERETEEEDSKWVLKDEDSCWGFIGMDHAESSLKEAFDYEVERLKKEIEHVPGD